MLLAFGVIGFNYEFSIFCEMPLHTFVSVHVMNGLERYGRAAVKKCFEFIRNHFGILFDCLLVIDGF